MTAALIFQSVLFLIGVLTVPLFLSFLSAPDFLVWILFTSIGGLTIQLEYALQIVSVRRLSRLWHQSGANSQEFQRELAATNKYYLLLAAGVLCLVGPAGYLYFLNFVAPETSGNWPIVWAIFIIGLVINFSFGRNNAVLLATNNTESFNYINTFSRAINFAVTAAFLVAGLALLGISLSFIISVAIGVACIRFRAKRVLGLGAHELASETSTKPELLSKSTTQLYYYAAFTIMAYILYRGALIIVPVIRPSEELSSYGLTLQIATITYAIAIIPTQVRLRMLMEHVLAHSRAQIIREI